MMAGDGRSCVVVFCAATQTEDEKHKRAASERTAVPMNTPEVKKNDLAILPRLRLPSEGFLPGEAAFFKARKLSQPQSSCIYINIGVSRIFQCFLVYLAGKTRCRRLPVSV